MLGSTIDAYLRQAVSGGVKQTELMVRLAHHTKIIPAYAVIRRHPVGQAPRVLEISTHAVLVAVARAIALSGKPAADGTTQEVVQRIEAQAAAMFGVYEAIDERTPPFIAHLEVVLAFGD